MDTLRNVLVAERQPALDLDAWPLARDGAEPARDVSLAMRGDVARLANLLARLDERAAAVVR